MDQAKRKRLEAAGWRIGTVAEFFNLSPEESAYLELRVRLSDALKKRRMTRGISQDAWASVVGSSQSRVAKMEARDPSVSIDRLIKALIATGVSLKELSRIVGFDEPKPVLISQTHALGEPGEWQVEASRSVVHPMSEASNSSDMRVSLP